MDPIQTHPHLCRSCRKTAGYLCCMLWTGASMSKELVGGATMSCNIRGFLTLSVFILAPVLLIRCSNIGYTAKNAQPVQGC